MWFSSNHYKNQRLNFEENQRANLLFRERALSNFMFMGKLKAEGFIIMGGLFRTSRVYNMQMCLMFFFYLNVTRRRFIFLNYIIIAMGKV